MQKNYAHTKALGRLRSLTLTLFATVSVLLASAAQAAPIMDGLTEVRLDAPIAEAVVGAGVTPSALGSGTFTGDTLTFGFPITGGELSDAVIPGSTIEHDGSGIGFTAGGILLELTNFVIDTTELVIFGAAFSTNPATGDALAVDSGVPLFALSTGSDVDGFPFIVSLTGVAAGALNATFGTDLFAEGLRIGTATTAPSVPEGPMMPLLGMAFAIFALRKLRAGQSWAALDARAQAIG